MKIEEEQEREAVPFQEFLATASRLFEHAASDASHEQRLRVERDGRIFSVAIRSQKRRMSKRTRQSALPESFFSLQGAGESEEPTDVGKHKHDYLAEAYADLHDTEQ